MSVLVDVALSAGFSWLSSLIKPRKTDTSTDSLPTLQFGELLQRAWGTVLVPGTLMFAGEPSLNNPIPVDGKSNSTPEELASYAVFLHTNPAAANLIAVRINGKVVATKSPAFPLTQEIKTTPVTDLSTGLSKYQQITFRFYNGLQVASDPMFIKNGYPELIYTGQCYLAIADSIRSVFGGRGATVGCVIEDNGTNTLAPVSGVYGFGDGFATLEYQRAATGIGAGSVYAAVNKIKATVPRGYQYVNRTARFDYPGSIAVNGAVYGTIVYGTGSNFYLSTDPGVAALPVAVVASTYGVSSAGTAGKYNLLTYPTGSVIPTVSTTEVIVGKEGSELRSITLGIARNAPFYNVNTQIFDNVGNPIATALAGEAVFGWNNTIYEASGSRVNNTSVAPAGLTLQRTDLRQIVIGLLAGTGISAVYNPGFDVPVIGFITNSKDVTTDISNLLAITNKIVYQRRDGTLVFSSYPNLPTNIPNIQVSDHVSAPEFNYEPFESQPDALDFQYLDLDREMDASSVRVGGDSVRIQSFNCNVVADRQTALIYAKNLLNRIKRQVISGTLTLAPEWNTIEGGDILVIDKLNPTGSDLTVIVLRVETGANMNVKIEFVNYAPINEAPSVVVNSNANSGTPVGNNKPVTYIVDTERRSDRIGLSYFTTSGSDVKRGGLTENGLPTYLSGSVLSLAGNAITVSTNTAPLVGEEYYILDTNTGQGSWISVLTSTLVSPNRYNLTVNAGLYASSVFSSATGLIILKILEESTINDNYLTLDLTQDGVTYTFPFSTRKRLGEPRLAGYLLGFETVEVYRQVYFAGDDGDLGLGITPVRSFVFRNLTTLQQIVITSGDTNINVPLVVSAGQTFTVTECSAAGVVFPYAVVNSFNV